MLLPTSLAAGLPGISDMWKEYFVRFLYWLLAAVGFSHEFLLKLLRNRIRHPQWARIVRDTADRDAFTSKRDGPRVLLLSMIGNMPLTNLEIPLALALQARGAKVEFVLCDGTQRPLCPVLTVDALEKKNKQEICRYCIYNAQEMLRRVPFLRYRTLSELVSESRNDELSRLAETIPADEIASFEEDGVRLGYAALQTALRYWRRGTFRGTADEESINRKMLHSALLTLEACKVLSQEGPIDIALFSHGLYESWGPAADFFGREKVYWATYGEMPMAGRYAFYANASNRLANISAPFKANWSDRPLTGEQRQQTLDYLRSRVDFSQDTMKLTFGSPVEKEHVFERLDLRSEIPVFALFGNVAWDAAAVGRDLIFGNFVEWVCETIEFVSRYPDTLQLVIKPHPSELIRGTRQSVMEEVERAFPRLPANVRLLATDTDIHAHSIMAAADAGIVHTSTVGMEMSMLGIPAIVTSWTHYRGYGFTFDPESREQYFEMLSDPRALAREMTSERKELAIKYFYVRNFRSAHDLSLVMLDGNRVPYGWNMGSLDDLLPGRNAALDFVCDSILSKSENFLQ